MDAAQPPGLYTTVGAAVYNPAGSTSQNLCSDLTGQWGVSANPLSVSFLNPGAGLTDAAGNPLVLGGAAVSLAGVIIDGVMLKVGTVAAKAGLYGAAAEIEILLGLSKPCVSVGTLTPATSAGVAAADLTQTTSTRLAFRVAVSADRVPGQLQVGALTLAAGASVTDTSGNPLWGAATVSALLPDVLLDGTAAVVTGAVATTTTVSLGGGSTEIRVSFSTPVVAASGTAVSLVLCNGAQVHLAYAAGPMLGFVYLPSAQTEATGSVSITQLAGANAVMDLFGSPVNPGVGTGAIGAGLAVLAAPATLQPQGWNFVGGCSGSWNRPTVPAEYVGVPVETLQQWLADSQSALQDVEKGATDVEEEKKPD